MSIAPEPSISRGEITLQPGYFTSSLYVNPLREDITALIGAFSERYNATIRPFELFKRLWKELGWSWLHLRVHDGRSRQSFVKITERLFTERLAKSEQPLARVVALFSLYTFHNTQPSVSTPLILPSLYTMIPADLYQEMLSLPAALEDPELQPLRPYVSHILAKMLEARSFYITPQSSTNAQNPSKLPREILVLDGQEHSATLQVATPSASYQDPGTSAPPKKKGRPSKRDKIRKAKEALLSLERYVDRTYVALPVNPAEPHMTWNPTAPGPVPVHTGHTLFAQAPAGSLVNYASHKNDLLATIQAEPPDGSQQAGLRRANEAVLERLKRIDEMAAENGLEVGGEGGEKTGLARVEKAVNELREMVGVGATGGILRLLEGAGMNLEGWQR
ncbi:hypothetical protein BC628DRAFT_1419396 [Trametes gibbosa]|nr:hypothetical protein BC628DRAFT_1419396 [Trametes gibbosa]